ncbi:TonB-dependent receptor domain-containing protein [Sphingomonas sp.]|uniref:TonB-dependent receptor domain-containing protein n=1 Tax=Sphingomonas sp. TaxID=28214 RepID=UPI0035680420
MRYVLATALAASAALCPNPAQARDTRYRVDIGAVDVADALAALSAQTGISFASDGPMPRRAVRAVRGDMTVSEALDRMLRSLDLRAVRVGSRAYRVVRRKPVDEGRAAPEPPVAPAEDVIVTGRKQSEILSGVAAPVAVYVPDGEDLPGASITTRDVARATQGLSLTNGQGGGRLFIRGIADSPFNGLSQSTVSVQFDDARVTYDAPEPGLRLIDVARVEVLKGPQGPLYGTGALGGVYRIVTNRPVLGLIEGEAGLGISSTASGGLGKQAEGVLNLPLISDRVAVRVVGYAAADPGWIDDAKFGRDLNRSVTLGGRVALRVVPFDGWTVDLSAVVQTIDTQDSQYVYRAGEARSRDVPVREPRSGRVEILQTTIAGSIGSLPLTIVTGLTRQNQSDVYDASASAAALGVGQPALYLDWRRYLVFDQEVRLGSAPGSRFAWVTGASFMLARTDANGPLLSGNGPMEGVLSAHRRVMETAIFADGSLPLLPRLRLGIGFRGFRTDTRDDRFEPAYLAARAKTSLSVTPSASLSYEIAPDQLLYARFGTAFRPGGLDTGNAVTRRYDADEVRSVDLGGRVRLDGGRLSLDGSLFRADWKNVQSDYLRANGLIATHNVGRATIIGADLSADWRLPDGWRLKAGAIWQRPRLHHAADGSALLPGVRLPVVPDVSARLALARDVDLYGWRITPGVSANLVGASRLSLDADLDRRTPAYVVGRFGVSAGRDRLTLRADIDNLLDASADTFAFGNPFSVRTTRQYTPLRPRTVSLSASRRF